MREYFDQIAKHIVESIEGQPISLPNDTPEIYRHAYLKTWVLATTNLKTLAGDDELPSVISDKLIRGLLLAGEEIPHFKKKYKRSEENTPIHWFLTFSTKCLEEGSWAMFFCRAMMLLTNAEDEIEENRDGALELIIEANMSLDAGIWLSEKAHSKLVDEDLANIYENYGSAITGKINKRQRDRGQKAKWKSLLKMIEDRCIEFSEGGTADTVDMKFHCDHVAKEAGVNTKTLQNKCAEAGLTKKFYPEKHELRKRS